MKQNQQTVSLGIASAVLIALTRIPVSAQQAPGAKTRASTLPAGQVLGQIGQSAGAIVLADSTVQGRVPVPAAAATPDTVEQQIAEVVRALPAGTTWARLYVPAPANGHWNGDAVASYAHALAQLVGTVGRAAPAGTVEILGRHVPADRAGEYVTALNLKLVYLVTNPRAPASVTMASSVPNWWQMAPAQRDMYAQQQAQRLLSLDPASRVQAMVQMMQSQEESPQQAVIRAMMSQMSDGERVELKQALGAARAAAGAGK
jgi:hypothetical protein